MPFYIFIIISSFVASVVGLIVIKENRVAALSLFSLLLLSCIVVEYVGWDMAEKNLKTTRLYNFFTIFEFVVYLVFFRLIFSRRSIKTALLVSIILYILISVLNVFFFQGMNTFHTYTYVLGCMLIVVYSIIYFYFLLRLPESGNLTKNPFFWIVTGLMFYYTCTFSLYGLNNIITERVGYYDKLLTIIGDLLNDLLYSLFIIAFLCRINLRKLLRSS
jgi:hypothetical protein